MDRREFIVKVAGGLLATPLAAEAQPTAPRWRVGVLLVLLSPTGPEAQAFRQGLRNAG